MKKSLYLAGLLFVISLTVNAQQKKNTVFLHKTETMNEIGLNEKQQVKITDLTQKSFKDIGKIRKDTNLSDSEKKSAISKIYRKRQKDYEAVLTAEQLKKYKDLKEASKKQ